MCSVFVLPTRGSACPLQREEGHGPASSPKNWRSVDADNDFSHGICRDCCEAIVRPKPKKLLRDCETVMKDDRKRCVPAGMDGYVSRPVQPEDRFAPIEQLGLAAGDAAKTLKDGAEDLIDTASLLARVDGDMKLLKELVELFQRDLPKLFSELQDAVTRRDAKALESAAHALKGSVGNFAARPAVEAALRLEQMGRRGDLTEAESAFQALAQEIERLKPALVDLSKEEVRK